MYPGEYQVWITCTTREAFSLSVLFGRSQILRDALIKVLPSKQLTLGFGGEDFLSVQQFWNSNNIQVLLRDTEAPFLDLTLRIEDIFGNKLNTLLIDPQDPKQGLISFKLQKVDEPNEIIDGSLMLVEEGICRLFASGLMFG